MCIKGYLDQQREGSSYAEGVKPAQHRSHNRREGLSPSRITPGKERAPLTFQDHSRVAVKNN